MYKNHVELIGFLGQDPELKRSAKGRAFTRLSIATAARWKDRSGEYQERTEWHTAFLWGKRAEAAARLLKKGAHVLVEGELRSREITSEQTGEVTRLWAVQANSFRNLRPERAGAAAEVDVTEADEPTVPDELPVF